MEHSRTVASHTLPGGRLVMVDPGLLEADGSGCIDVYAALARYAWAETVMLRAGAPAAEDDPDEVLVGEVVLDGAPSRA